MSDEHKFPIAAAILIIPFGVMSIHAVIVGNGQAAGDGFIAGMSLAMIVDWLIYR